LTLASFVGTNASIFRCGLQHSRSAQSSVMNVMDIEEGFEQKEVREINLKWKED
jgi:hypothetical protein